MNPAISGAELSSLLSRTSFSKSYFRAGVLFSVLFSAGISFTLSYAIAANAQFSWYAPAFLATVVCMIMFLLSLMFTGIASALEKLSARHRSASGEIAAHSILRQDIRFRVRATKRGMRRGFGTFEKCLVVLASTALLVACGALGTVIGGSGISVFTGEAFPIAMLDTQDPVGYCLKIATATFLVAALLLLGTRIFASEGTSHYHVFVMDSSYDSEERSSTHEELAGPSSLQLQSTILPQRSDGFAYMISGVEHVSSLLPRHHNKGDDITEVECVLVHDVKSRASSY